MQPGQRGNRGLDLAFGTGLLASLGGLVLLVVVLVTRGVERAGTWAPVLSTGVALAVALVTVVTSWLGRRAAAGQPARSEQVTRAARELQAVVRDQWRKEAEARSLGDPDPMPVRWRLSDPAVMDHDEHIAPIPLLFSGRSDRIPALIDQFRWLRRRRLVIVGAPGSGKTTLAVQLLLHLLDGWQAGEPVPVLLSLASWDPQTQPRVQDWLAAQLSQTYPDLRTFGPDTAQRLADQGWLLPVLDGLDEIPPDRRREVIGALNASLHRDTGLIMTSRTAEYTETVHTCDVLTAAAVIEPEPLTAHEVATYLTDRLPRQPGESWQAVLSALRDGTAGALAEVAASPLWLLRIVYIEGHRDPQPMIDPTRYPDAATIQHHLLEELIPATVRSRPPLPRGKGLLRPRHHHDPEQVRRWLTTLAIELRDARTRDWQWWRLARHTFTTTQVRSITWVCTLMVVLSTLALITMSGSRSGLYGLLEALVYVLTGGLVSALYSDAPAHIDLRTPGRSGVLGVSLVFWLVVGLVFWLVVELAKGRGYEPGLAVLFVLGLILEFLLTSVLVFGLVSLVTSPSIARRASSPAESQRGDRRLTVLVVSIAVLAGLVLELMITLYVGSDRVTFGLGGGLGLGLLLGLQMSKACWSAFVAASLWLGARRRLPWRLMGFLEDTYRLGLLRVVGPVYQFRHAALQDHLAPPSEVTPVAAAKGPTPP